VRDYPNSAPTASAAEDGAGFTVAEVARRYRVGEDKIRAWIRRGELAAVNTATVLCARPRWVISHDALAEFERRRAGGPPPKQETRRRRTPPGFVDYYPD
jgi:transposase